MSEPTAQERLARMFPQVTLDARSVRAWAEESLAALGEERAAIDSLNVFPVPDGDTGTNMFLTLESACQAVAEVCEIQEDASLRDVADAFSQGAVLGARGNSGVILAQIVRGVSTELARAHDGTPFDAAMVRRGFRRASDEAYGAVTKPVEGTILTVARAAAEAAEAYDSDDLVGVIEEAVAASHRALAQTQEMLPVLRDAGVVDAGGQGLAVVYDALLDVVTGVRRRRPGRGARPKMPVHRAALPDRHGVPSAHLISPHAPPAAAAYEVMYLFDGHDTEAEALKESLSSLGDSLVVTGADPMWNVHVHVHDAGAAIEAGMALGDISRLRITYLPDAVPINTRTGRAVVAVAHGPGIATLLGEQGVIVVPAKPRRRPSTAELLDGIHASQCAEVVLLPSDSDTLAVAEAAAEQARAAGVEISVIPTRSIVQSLAAVAVHDPGARFPEDVVAMTRASSATRYAAVTVASREALTMAGPCRPGDILGLSDGDIVEIGIDVAEVGIALVERLLSVGGELVTLVTGAEAGSDLAGTLEAWLTAHHPGVDALVIEGGQPLWPLIIGVE